MRMVILCLLLACCAEELPLPPPPPPPPPKPAPAARPKVTPAVRAWIKGFRRSENEILNAVTRPDASPEDIRSTFEKAKIAQHRLQDVLNQGRHATPQARKAAHDAVTDFNAAVKTKAGPSRRRRSETAPATPPLEPPPPPIPAPSPLPPAPVAPPDASD